MEAQCEYFMYFPAAPISSLSDPADYATLPRRNHAYLGEVVQFLLVLRSRTPAGRDDGSRAAAWKQLAGSLSALASACVAESREQRPGEEYQPDLLSTSSEEDEGEEPGGRAPSGEGQEGRRTFTQCSPRLIHNSRAAGGRRSARDPVKVRRNMHGNALHCVYHLTTTCVGGHYGSP